jgi:hypothetical protein
MFQSKRIGFIILLGSFISLCGMNEINKSLWQSDTLDAIVPTIEATVMTTVVTLPQAMMYIPFQEAIAFALTSGAITVCLSTVGYALPSIACGFLLDCEQPNDTSQQSQYVIEWKKPLYISLAFVTTCFMVAVNHRTLSTITGV